MELLLAIIPPVQAAAQYLAQGTDFNVTDDGIKYLAAGLAMGLGAVGPALAIGNLVGRAMDALGRNPEALPAIQVNMILGLAFAEAIGIYALVVAVMIGFVIAFDILGILPAMMLLCFGLPILWGERRLHLVIPYAIIFPLAIYGLFAIVLRVHFEPSPLVFW